MSMKSIGSLEALGEANTEPGFALTAKSPRVRQLRKKTTIIQEDTGMPAGVAVPVISNPHLGGCVAKKMRDDLVWIAMINDLDSMTTMQLRTKYAGEANTHRNMLQRVKTYGAVVHSSFRSFPDFLQLVGPKPTARATLDRINNDDPEYAPGKVRWADKGTQNRNKGDSLIFTCLNTGRSYTASQLATKQGVSSTAIRARRKKGWTDEEIIAGKRTTHLVAPVTKKVPAQSRSSFTRMTAAEMEFRRDREYCEHLRQSEGQEYFICTPAEIQSSTKDDFPWIGTDEWLRSAENFFRHSKFPKWWAQYKHHVRFHALQPFQQAWVLEVDPAQGQKLELSDSL
ncbi:hypothetical protein SAMN04488004_12219 [Loktanella salsilacus]|uniref:Uncharacterized protein n=1 Tax=Loktanella salsilacus TaxID=195913 RepID=A0A1I4I2J8_9RHOB|nr:hypothetical protein [Loktanella salsilacus]SFL48648.1 hypothetical protein SAMN04488004_12219 [Loktanella salsilacus]